MNIRSYTSRSYHLFQVFGSLGLPGFEEFSDKIEEAIASYREKVVFDFRETTSIDAATVRYLERFAQSLNSIGKNLYFVSLDGQPAEMLDLLCLLRDIKIFPSIEMFNTANAVMGQRHDTQPQPADTDASHSISMLISLLAASWQAQTMSDRSYE